MQLAHFFSIDAVDNVPGYHRYWFISDDAILFVPPATNGIIDFEKITYAPDKDTWYSGGAIFESVELGEKEQKSSNGSLYPISINAKTAGIQPATLSLFHRKRNGRFILIVADNNGNYFLCGEPGNGLKFSFARDAAYLAFTYTGGYTLPCYFLANYLGSNPTIPGGGDGGGTVTIKRVDGTTITTVTAPAEYTVANTNVLLKDSDGTLLSTTVVKPANGSQNIPAPNGQVELQNTDTDTISTFMVKSGETKVQPVPDTHVVAKNTLAEIIHDEYVASGVTANINIGDSTVNIKDSAGTLLFTENVPAEKVVNVTAPDATVNLNGAPWLTPRSGQTVSATLKNEIGATVTPTVTGADLVINSNAVLAAYINGDL